MNNDAKTLNRNSETGLGGHQQLLGGSTRYICKPYTPRPDTHVLSIDDTVLPFFNFYAP